MKKHVFIFTAKQGKPDLGSDANRARFNDTLKNNEGKTFRIEMMETKRSLSQNSYYWLYLGVIARETGDDENSLHEYFRRTLLPPKSIKAMSKEIRVPTSTTELTKSEMAEYLERICALTNIPLPDTAAAGFYTETN